MATKKTTATAPKKGAGNNSRKASESNKAQSATVKNNPTSKEDEVMKNNKTTATAPKKGAGNKTTAKKGNKKNTQKNTPTNKGRVKNNKTQQAEERRKAEEKATFDALRENANTTRTAAKETRRDIHTTFAGAKAEVKEAHTPLFYMNLLNKMAEGKKEVQNVNPSALAKAYDMTSTATPTAHNRRGFSYDVLKTNSKGDICRIVLYTPDPTDEHTTNPAGAHIVTTKRYNAVEVMDLYSGQYLLIPVSINENGILSAVESYLQAYAAAIPDLLAFGKRYDQAKQKRQAEKEAQKREKEIRDALKAAQERAEKATREAEEAQKQAEEDTHRANVAAMTTLKRSILSRLMRVAAIF